SSTTPPTPIGTPTPTTTVVAAPRLSATAKDEGTGSKPGVPDVPSNDSEEELSWNSSDDEDVDEQTKGRDKTDLSEMELKKILVDKIEGNKDQMNNETFTRKDPSLDQTGGLKDEEKEEEPMQTTCQMEEPSHSPRRPPTPDRDWNKTLPTAQGNAQSWISALAKQTDARSSFNELLDTPIDFSNFIMNRLDVDTLTPELLAGPTYELMRGSCNSLTELEYHLEEVYKATTDQLDWVNPEGQQYPHNLLQPLPLILDNRGRRVIPFEHFINIDLEYLRGGDLSRKYTTSVTKTKAEDYGHIKWIKDLVPRAMWIQEPISYDKHALWEVSHWGQKHYGSGIGRVTENLLIKYFNKVDILKLVSHFLEAARENLSLKIYQSSKITKLPNFTVPHCSY
nr:alpha N-terminal protein methyltransferase 1 isoform X2 [Tanacetum cinerariifolium]